MKGALSNGRMSVGLPPGRSPGLKAVNMSEGGGSIPSASTKPPYTIPSMSEIAAIPHNGFGVVSTFSGCGGSCLGYRMAGYRVLWASEFIPAAADVYRLNHPTTILDTRDIRQVEPEEILTATGLKVGQLDLLDGSPPCASFSTAGKRAKHWGKVKQYSDRAQRTDDLFFQYVRILKGLRPKVFVAENVAGLVRGVAKGMFLEILAALKGAGYRVIAKLLDASWLGVPTSRVRLIFVGVREDLNLEPVHPKPLPYRYTIRDALPGLAGINTKHGVIPADQPCPTIQTHGNRYTQSELTPVEPEADITKYAIGAEWDKMGKPGTQSEKYFQLVRPALDQPSPTITAMGAREGFATVCHPTERRKFSIAELKRLSSFPADFILTGSYAQQWERIGRAVPPLMMKAIAQTIAEGVLCKL